MSWTTPRTWTAHEVVTATMMNAHVRDNLAIIKVTRDAAGRIADLSSTTLADLSSANLTGIGFLAANSAYAAGKAQFRAAARLVLPVGADRYQDLGGGLRRGAWVEGDYLHHIASNQTTEYRYLGEYVSTPSAVPGSVWVEGDYLHYIDADGDERRCSSAGVAGHSDASALAGSTWAETYVHWISEGGASERPGHADIAHSDGTAHYDSHTDTAHGDSHSDTGHADSHADSAHVDGHVDYHDDVPYADEHEDHDDVVHEDAHGDVGHVDSMHLDAHGDTAHGDSHTDTAHVDSHVDSHADEHEDHDDHGDVAEQNQPTVVA